MFCVCIGLLLFVCFLSKISSRKQELVWKCTGSQGSGKTHENLEGYAVLENMKAWNGLSVGCL